MRFSSERIEGRVASLSAKFNDEAFLRGLKLDLLARIKGEQRIAARSRLLHTKAKGRFKDSADFFEADSSDIPDDSDMEGVLPDGYPNISSASYGNTRGRERHWLTYW